MRARFAALAIVSLLAACGEQQNAGGAQGASSALGRCGSDAFAQRMCADPKLGELDQSVRQALVAEAASVSDAGAQLLAQSQSRWLEAQRVACGVIDPDAQLTADQNSCIESKLRERAAEAQTAVQEIGGYVFQRVEMVNAQPVTAQAAADSGLGDAAPAAIVRDIRYPRIDGASTPQAQRFNQLVAQQPQYRLEDQTDEAVSYEIVYAGPALISVRFNVYENTLGAAHPNNSYRAVTVLMSGEGRPIQAGDVFRSGSGWEDFITQRSIAAITRQFREYEFQPPPQDVRESATKPHLWLIGQDGLTILFPPYSFGGPHALGGAEVLIPWSDLRPYLNPAAPAPIRAGA
ncbi:MAG: RsiV family protein [Caulobacterales bacterium]